MSGSDHRRFLLVFLVQFLLVLAIGNVAIQASTARTTPRKTLPPQDYLSFTHYQNTCPQLETIINNVVTAWVKKDRTLAASIIRLHFHDCSVRGCDASILLNHTGSERTARTSRTLRGFQVIDEIKAEVERRCPRTVSCADILTAAARDATLLVGGPFWEVPFGRKDGRISIAKEADEQVPQGRENVTTLLQFVRSRGLNILDLVVLSGIHTIGRSTCGSFQQRLANFNRTTKTDPSMDIKYLNSLKKLCKTPLTYANLDVTTPTKFDTAYYTNLANKKGLLTTDQELYADKRTAPFVSALATQPYLFINQFVGSMIKLGNVRVIAGPMRGDVRSNCNFVN